MCIKEKRVLSLAVSIQTFVTALLYHGSTPFILEEGKERAVSAGLSGLIISFTSATSLVLGFCTGYLAIFFGHRRLLIYCVLMESIFSTLFALLEYVESWSIYLSLALGLRFFLGGHIFLHKTLGYMLASKYLY